MHETPWQRATAQRKSQRQEEKLAAEPGGRKQINSGRLWHSKGDVRLGEFLVDNKGTDAHSFILTEKDWVKIEREAMQTSNLPLPALQIDFPFGRLFVMRLTDHQEREARLSFLEDELRRLRGKHEVESER